MKKYDDDTVAIGVVVLAVLSLVYAFVLTLVVRFAWRLAG